MSDRISSLPLELLFHIAHFAYPHGLDSIASLSCTSRHLSQILTPELDRLLLTDFEEYDPHDCHSYYWYFLENTIRLQSLPSLKRLLAIVAPSKYGLFNFESCEVDLRLITIAASLRWYDGLDLLLEQAPIPCNGEYRSCIEYTVLTSRNRPCIIRLLSFITAHEGLDKDLFLDLILRVSAHHRESWSFDPSLINRNYQCPENLQAILEVFFAYPDEDLSQSFSIAIDKSIGPFSDDSKTAAIISLLLTAGTEIGIDGSRRHPLIAAARWGLEETFDVLWARMDPSEVDVQYRSGYSGRSQTALTAATRFAILPTEELTEFWSTHNLKEIIWPGDCECLVYDGCECKRWVEENPVPGPPEGWDVWVGKRKEAARGIVGKLVKAGADVEWAVFLMEGPSGVNEEGRKKCLTYLKDIEREVKESSDIVAPEM